MPGWGYTISELDIGEKSGGVLGTSGKWCRGDAGWARHLPRGGYVIAFGCMRGAGRRGGRHGSETPPSSPLRLWAQDMDNPSNGSDQIEARRSKMTRYYCCTDTGQQRSDG